ncbi:Asp_protease_2 domain-containing protein [Cucumis melo var. makuwa]|uniref:Asp_protease_2 domain-containing protein n=1 Tax=Cucumis melo var. makuwa TaxID=1194695 RepID=A0A5A7TUH7_CUCMM|nr:Asp_protease_2 domain-containing protein [Cucumis melo var. makuwa]
MMKTPLGEGFRKNEGREFHCPTYRQTSETNDDEVGRMERPVYFVVVKMDDFDVVLEMEFLLEHQVISMPSAKCLVIIGSSPTIVQADIH